ncbi:hypothetical protein HON71_05365 [Candidatus Woesearchaeota archaeon]|jgi:hypothetical protein|nr:hypothetical protein [Candidatus Woesearchaeota archaeon]MBT5342085.1 hypothetical protein [Candidatus Woesearchaeota archaeon]
MTRDYQLEREVKSLEDNLHPQWKDDVRDLKERLKEGFVIPPLYRLETEGALRKWRSGPKHDIYMLREEQTLYIGVPGDDLDVCWGCNRSAEYLITYLELTDGEAVKDMDVKFVLAPGKELIKKNDVIGNNEDPIRLEDLTKKETDKVNRLFNYRYDKHGSRYFKRCGDVYAALAAVITEQYGAKSVSVAFPEHIKTQQRISELSDQWFLETTEKEREEFIEEAKATR